MILNKEKDMSRRMTPQKRIVFQALEELGHASIESLIEYIRMHHGKISLATIYRNINTLLLDNKIKLVKLQNQDVLETVKEEHVHFVCEQCGNIIDFKMDKQDVLKNSKTNCMHQIHYCDISFYGICQNCTKEGEKE